MLIVSNCYCDLDLLTANWWNRKEKKDFVKDLLFVTHILLNKCLGITGQQNQNDKKYEVFRIKRGGTPIFIGEFMSWRKLQFHFVFLSFKKNFEQCILALNLNYQSRHKRTMPQQNLLKYIFSILAYITSILSLTINSELLSTVKSVNLSL